MKTLKILLLLLALIPFSNIYSQYFVDQDKIDELKNSNANSYYLPSEETGEKLLYLANITSFKGYYSDVKLGFDKEEYNSNDMIIVTLKRGYENETDSENVIIYGCVEVFSDQIEINKIENGPYQLYLKKGQEVKIKLSCRRGKSVRLNFNFGPIISYGWPGESREYIIRFSDGLEEEVQRDSVSNNKLIINNFMIGPTESKTVPPDTGEKVHSPSINY
ncbi:MAG: hypothetical protein IIC76_06705 [Bacteroidetes bacterium]|nr:hypothetical protein [Bacteroidota bacterium]